MCSLQWEAQAKKPGRRLSIFQLESLWGEELWTMQSRNQGHRSILVVTRSTLRIPTSVAKGLFSVYNSSALPLPILNTPGQKDAISQSLNSGALIIWFSALKKNLKQNLADTWTLSQSSSTFPLQEQSSKMNQHQGQNVSKPKKKTKPKKPTKKLRTRECLLCIFPGITLYDRACASHWTVDSLLGKQYPESSPLKPMTGVIVLW